MCSSVEKYGESSSQADWILENQILQLRPKSIVDFGAGGGKNSILARKLLGKSRHIIAIDGYEKAVEHLIKMNLCDKAECCLMEKWIENNEKMFDLAIFGDVIEHLNPKLITKVLRRTLQYFKYTIIVVPLHHIYQLEKYDNKLELHNSYITQNYFDDYPVKEKHIIFGQRWVIMNVLLTSSEAEPEIPFKNLRKVAHYPLIVLNYFCMAGPAVHFLKRVYLKYRGSSYF
jgi:hypothetical protein